MITLKIQYFHTCVKKNSFHPPNKSWIGMLCNTTVYHWLIVVERQISSSTSGILITGTCLQTINCVGKHMAVCKLHERMIWLPRVTRGSSGYSYSIGSCKFVVSKTRIVNRHHVFPRTRLKEDSLSWTKKSLKQKIPMAAMLFTRSWRYDEHLWGPHIHHCTLLQIMYTFRRRIFKFIPIRNRNWPWRSCFEG